MSKEIEPQQAVRLPSDHRVGQATMVEQSRAVAEVHAAILVARQFPRDMHGALAEMQETCKQTALAERAFFRFSRGSGTVSGPSIHLARELARCWGNIDYGISEMRRDDDHGQSEMKAWAWDMEKNSRSSTTFVVPHKRDKRGGAEKLTDMRDIYENNANNGARRVRECIFSVLPQWYVEDAKERCNQTLKQGGGIPLPQRITKAIKGFEGIGVSVDQLEQKMDRPTGKWTENDVAQLGVIFKSIERGEISKNEEFPPVRVTTAEILRSTPEENGDESAEPQP